MGSGASSGGNNEKTFYIEDTDKLSVEAMVEHFQPPSFPLEPRITETSIEMMRISWQNIRGQQHVKEGGTTISGVVYFYGEFYKRLFQRSDSFTNFFSGNMSQKGQVLIRIVDFLTTLDIGEKDMMFKKIDGLGKMHSMKRIRPWMFSVFIETLVSTVGHCLGDDANDGIMDAWANGCAFVLRRMLPPAIKESIVDTESMQNAYADDLQINENAGVLEEIEEEAGFSVDDKSALGGIDHAEDKSQAVMSVDPQQS